MLLRAWSRRRFHAITLRALAGWAAGSIACATAQAAPTTAAPSTMPTTMPTSASLAQDRATTTETELAALLQQRLDAKGQALVLLDFQIDVRVIQRWLLASEAAPDVDDETQAVLALRVQHIQSIGDLVGQRINNAGKALTQSQLSGLSKLHKLTYELPEQAIPGSADDVCRAAATALILASNPTPAEVQHLPTMRPKVAATQPTTSSARRPDAQGSELNDRIAPLRASPAIKRQLQLLSESAALAGLSPDSKKQEEAKDLTQALRSAIELTEGLDKGAGLDPAVKPKIEQQVLEGLTLYTDSRTRAAGKQRLDAMGQYHDSMLRVQQLHLTPAQQTKLGPVFIWANKTPEGAPKVLEAIDQYFQLTARFDSRKEAPATNPNVKKAVDVARREFVAQRSAFMEDAAEFGKDNANGTMFTPGPAPLTSHIEVMKQSLATLDTLDRLPHALQAVLAYKPKPFGALDKKINLALVDLATVAGTHEVSLKVAADIIKLGDLIDSLATPAGVTPDIVKLYTGGKGPAVETRKATLLSELASELAGGKEFDSSVWSKLETFRTVMATLSVAQEVETALRGADTFGKWADWSVSAAQLRAMVVPYRDATVAAVEGFAIDNATPLFRWNDAYKKYEPMLTFIRRVGPYADQLKDLPGPGLAESASKLLTPLADQTFWLERDTCLDINLWQRAAPDLDAKSSETMFDSMLKRLKKRLESPGPPEPKLPAKDPKP